MHRALDIANKLVAISSKSGDKVGSEDLFQTISSLLPQEASVNRLPCSSKGFADDIEITLKGSGQGRVLFLGHLDTVFALDETRGLKREETKLFGAGTSDMKGGVAFLLCLMEEMTERKEEFAEIRALLVFDEEGRRVPLAHSKRYKNFDACLVFEAGEEGGGVVTKRKAASTIEVVATGRSSHVGAKPEEGLSAIRLLTQTAVLAESFQAAQVFATMIEAGEGHNVLPGGGRMILDYRADTLDDLDHFLEKISRKDEGGEIKATALRRWPGMDSREEAEPVLEEASRNLGRVVHSMARGGISDAAWFAGVVPIVIDGLGPLGGREHSPDEYIETDTLGERLAISRAILDATLDSIS